MNADANGIPSPTPPQTHPPGPFRETFAHVLTRPSDAAALQSFGELLGAAILEYSHTQPVEPGSFPFAEINAALRDVRAAAQWLRNDVGGHLEASDPTEDEAAACRLARTYGNRWLYAVERFREELDTIGTENSPRRDLA